MTQNFRITPRLLTLTIALLLSLGGSVLAQELTGNIVGSVKDANGAAIKGAMVTVTNAATKQVTRTATTDDDGSFSARDLPVGIYSVTVEAPNFKRHVENNVQVDVGTRKAVDINLEVGSVAEVVT
ncbi:MAG: carboxypeptidase-like regulatory domain-containing protein, partial [Pyrinomonadaceae bacterium]